MSGVESDLPGAELEEPDESCSRLFPSLGYFGGTATDFLEISVDAEISELRLTVEDSEASFLNLRGIQFHDGKFKTRFGSENISVWQSSFRVSDDIKDPKQLLNMRGLHTGLEKYPTWGVVSDEPSWVGTVRIYNRVDGWGFRARRLRVDITAGGLRQTIYFGHSRLSADLAVTALSDWFPGAIPVAGLGTATCSRSELLKVIADDLESRNDISVASGKASAASTSTA